MIRIGEISLWVAVLMAALASVLSIAGGVRRRARLVKHGALAAYATFGCTLLAAIGLWTALFQRDFSLRYVAANSSVYLSMIYTFAAFWAGPPGSLLLWTLILTLYAGLASVGSQRANQALMPFVIGTLSAVSLCFLMMIVLGANPFERLDWAPPDGLGLNPQLQHPGMLLHLPVLYVGLVGTAVPFAFGVSALIVQQFDAEWLAAVRRWATLSWFFLTIGIVLGMWWAYLTPGWGGVWAWDAIENASLLPWLTSTAFLHSILLLERRGMLRAWNVTLVVVTFLLSILGLYVMRSGVSTSVRATPPAPVAGWILVLFLTATFMTAFLVHTRLSDLRSNVLLENMRSREGALISNNAVLVAIGVATLWGTLFPILSHAGTGERAVFGPPFFNAVNGALGVGLLALMGIGPLLSWGGAPMSTVRRQFTWPLVVATSVLVILLALGVRQGVALVTYTLAGFAFGTIKQEFITGIAVRRRTHAEGLFVAALRMIGSDRRRYGGYVVHAGMVAFLCALAGIAFRKEIRAVLSTGDSTKVTDPYGREWTFASQGISAFDEPDRSVVAVSLAVRRDGKSMGLLTSEQRQQIDERGEPTFEPTTKVGVLSSPKEDVYLVLTNRIDKDVAALQIRFNPLTWWVWFGGVMMAFGGLIVMWPKAHHASVVLRHEDAEQAPVRVAVSDDDVEAAIRRARESQKSCGDCGPRPEPDAIYCSNCGVRLTEP